MRNNPFRNLIYVGLNRIHIVQDNLQDAIHEAIDYARRTDAEFRFLTGDMRLMVIVQETSDPHTIFKDCQSAAMLQERFGRIIGPEGKNFDYLLPDPPNEYFCPLPGNHNDWQIYVGKNVWDAFKAALEYAKTHNTLITFMAQSKSMVSIGPESDINRLFRQSSESTWKDLPLGP